MIRSGDIVVFQAPLSISPDRADWVKRIIGLPGDHIQTKSGVLWINGQPVNRERIADYVDENGRVVIRYIETLPNGVSHTILEQQGDNGVLDNTSEDIVPPDHFYVLGDNRDDSMDSRVPRMGPVPNDNYRGRVMFIYWSRNWRRIGNVQ